MIDYEHYRRRRWHSRFTRWDALALVAWAALSLTVAWLFVERF